MDNLPDIPVAEHQVMKVIWNDNPITAMEIIKDLKSRILEKKQGE